MNEENKEQDELFPTSSHIQTIPVLYIPIDGPPRIDQRPAVNYTVGKDGLRKLLPAIVKGEAINLRDDGTVVVSEVK